MKTNYEQIVDVTKIGQHSAADMNAIFAMAEQERFTASIDDSPRRLLLCIDVQKDFIEGGALAVPGSIWKSQYKINKKIKNKIDEKFQHRFSEISNFKFDISHYFL